MALSAPTLGGRGGWLGKGAMWRDSAEALGGRRPRLFGNNVLPHDTRRAPFGKGEQVQKADFPLPANASPPPALPSVFQRRRGCLTDSPLLWRCLGWYAVVETVWSAAPSQAPAGNGVTDTSLFTAQRDIHPHPPPPHRFSVSADPGFMKDALKKCQALQYESATVTQLQGLVSRMSQLRLKVHYKKKIKIVCHDRSDSLEVCAACVSKRGSNPPRSHRRCMAL